MKKLIIYIVLAAAIVGCNGDFLEEIPQDAVGQDPIFGSESGLELYTYSFYNGLPSAMDIFNGDNISDYGSRRDITLYLAHGAFTANESSGWSWSRSEEHTSELQSRENLVCRLLLEKKNGSICQRR